MSKTYIAKPFLSVQELVEELGYAIPKDTPLFDQTGQKKGTYLEHTNDNFSYFHTMRTPGYKSVPFAQDDLGIFITIGFDKRVIDNQLLANDQTRMI